MAWEEFFRIKLVDTYFFSCFLRSSSLVINYASTLSLLRKISSSLYHSELVLWQKCLILGISIWEMLWFSLHLQVTWPPKSVLLFPFSYWSLGSIHAFMNGLCRCRCFQNGKTFSNLPYIELSPKCSDCLWESLSWIIWQRWAEVRRSNSDPVIKTKIEFIRKKLGFKKCDCWQPKDSVAVFSIKKIVLKFKADRN